MKKWFVAQTKPGQERIAEINLARQGFDVFLPRMIKTKKSFNKKPSAKNANTKKVMAPVLIPLFAGYIFVAIDMEYQRWRSVNGTYGVIGLVSFGGRPPAVPASVMTALQDRTDEKGVIDLPDLKDIYAEGEAVTITDGPFIDHIGQFSRVSDRERVILLIDLLGQKVDVRVDAQHVRAVAS